MSTTGSTSTCTTFMSSRGMRATFCGGAVARRRGGAAVWEQVLARWCSTSDAYTVACLQRQTACVVCGHKRASWVDAEPVESLQCVVQRRTGVSNRRRVPPNPSTERHHGATQQVRTPGPAIPAREVSSVHGHVRGGKRQGMEAGWLYAEGHMRRRTAASRPAASPGSEDLVLTQHQLEHVDQPTGER